MANYARVVIPTVVSTVELDSVIDRIAQDKLCGYFTFSSDNTYRWLDCPLLEGLCMEFFYNPERVKKENSTVVDFRHGHSVPFMWYAEGAVRENLAAHYNAVVIDDCDDKETSPRPEQFSSFAQYLIHGFKPVTQTNVNVYIRRKEMLLAPHTTDDEKYLMEVFDTESQKDIKAFLKRRELKSMGLEEAPDEFKKAFGIDWI